MELEAIESVQGRVSQSPADVWAAKLQVKLEDMRQTAASSAASSPNVITSASYSPVLHAQVASYAMYTQAGTTASLLTGLGITPHNNPGHAVPDHPNDIKAVGSVGGASVDTVA